MENAEQIFRQYYEDVYRFLRGLTANEQLAEELCQETVFRAIKHIDDYKGSSGIRTWLCSIAKNQYFTYLKKQKHIADNELEAAIPDKDSQFFEILEDKETAAIIHKYLHELKEPYKEVFMLRVFGELSFREIAEIFGKNDHWACVSYHRAKDMIRKRMKEDSI